MLVAWNEKGVLKDSYISFFRPSASIRQYYYYMYNCGSFVVNELYDVNHPEGGRPSLFLYITSGALHVQYEGRKYQAEKGQAVLLNCMKPHHYWCQSNCEFLFFHFDGRQASQLTDHLTLENGSCVFTSSKQEEISRTMHEVFSRLIYQDTVSDLSLSASLYHILTLLEKDDGSQDQTRHYSQPVADTIAYLRAHIRENTTLKQLADQAGLSPYYFSHLFQKETGVSPIRYASNMKISYAKVILRTSDSSVSEIASMLGYSSDASFINAFHHRTGRPPKRYRQEILMNDRHSSGR